MPVQMFPIFLFLHEFVRFPNLTSEKEGNEQYTIMNPIYFFKVSFVDDVSIIYP